MLKWNFASYGWLLIMFVFSAYGNSMMCDGKSSDVSEPNMLLDDGRRDQDGMCLDSIYIFSGRAGTCKPAGASTAFKNCCEDKGKVYTDSTGSIASTARYAGAIRSVYKISKGAYLAYKTEIARGATKQAASLAAKGAAKEQLAIAFDPTSLAISVGIYFAMDYLQKSCGQADMETAMLRGSGYCVEVGEYCKDKAPGLGCIQKEKSYCCFNSKMARIIQEQGRNQLKSIGGWGDHEAPNCRGFTPEEFQALDFSKIDLSEYYSDLVHKMQGTVQADIKGKVNDFMQMSH